MASGILYFDSINIQIQGLTAEDNDANIIFYDDIQYTEYSE